MNPTASTLFWFEILKCLVALRREPLDPTLHHALPRGTSITSWRIIVDVRTLWGGTKRNDHGSVPSPSFRSCLSRHPLQTIDRLGGALSCASAITFVVHFLLYLFLLVVLFTRHTSTMTRLKSHERRRQACVTSEHGIGTSERVCNVI